MTALPSARLSQAARRRTGVGDPERIEAVRTGAAGQQQFGRLADQAWRPATERRIRHDEHETAPGIGLVGEIRGQ